VDVAWSSLPGGRGDAARSASDCILIPPVS
jgi:hypothetical protein